MKHIALILFLSLSVFAENMTLGPYNDPEFKTQIQLTQEKEAREKAATLKNKKALKVFEKRQLELKAIEQKAEDARQTKARNLKLKKEYQAQELRNAQAREKIERNLSLGRKQEREKNRLQKQEEKKLLLAKKKAQRLTIEDSHGLDLIPEQADISVNNPDDIETELNNIDRLRFLLLHSKNTPESIKEYIRFLNALQEDYNLDFAFAYRGIAQAELNKEIASAGGKYDLTARYRPQEGTDIALRLEGRHQVGNYSSTEFRNEIGSLSTTSAGYKHEDIYLAQFWIQQDINDFIFRAGKIDPSSFIDSHQFKSSSRFFFNATFSASPYNSFPPLGLGLAAKYTKERYYISSEITDSNAVSGGRNNDIFEKNNFYSALELGLTPKDGSKYHITTWHRDSSDIRQESKGMILSIVHAINHDTHLILRGALSDHATAKRYASIGLGKLSLFQEHDISGFAIGTLVPSNDNEREQTTIESFYRIDPLPGVQLSADLQFIYHPSAGTQDWAVLPSFRLRVLF